MTQLIQTLLLILVASSASVAQNHIPQTVCQPLISSLPYNNDSLKVPARFFDNGSYDLETPTELLRYSYSTNIEDTIRTFTCESPVNNVIEVYVFDEDGAYDFCTPLLKLNHHYCDSMSIFLNDTLSPVIFTYNKTIPTLPDSNFSTCLTADEFVIYAFDNGDVTNQFVQFSFSEIASDTLRCFSCQDEGQYPLAIFGTDTVGNQIDVPILITVVAFAGCDQMLDTMRPVAICKENATFSIDTNKQAVVYPHDFDDGSYDNVTEPDDLYFYFEEFFEDSLIFSCEDIGSHTISIFVADESFNASLCTTEVIIEDPNNFCNISSIERNPLIGNFSLHPNPSSGFYVKSNYISPNRSIQVKVYNMMGELVYFNVASEFDEFISPDIPAGMYSVILKTDNATNQQFKWIKIN